ncbi:MAG TPA: TetR/AcrR family transcriptional regulator [Solirubrobacteraceae bacterium]|jgi:AcrR family transcriptional regulator|nr:TetR/AcrR family transcriptional regulator [Solirubrobacteraceae bacterium]
MPDPRPARTRGRLIAAAHDLIVEKGVAGLRIAEITEQAGVALGSFYNHFATKEELVEAVALQTLTSLADEIVTADPSDGDAGVVAITALRRFVRLGYDDVAFARLLVNLSRGEELFLAAISPYARTALSRAAAEGVFAIEDVDVAVTTIVGGGLALIRRILDGELHPDADAVYARAVLLGFGVAPGEAARIIGLSDPPP